MMTLQRVNALSAAEFMTAFGDIAEHSPWVAKGADAQRPFSTRDAVIAAFENAMSAASESKCLALIRAHPDLATKAKLTSDSTREQQGAGLDALSEEEFQEFTRLNDQYKDKFGFPFIFAVKGATKYQILSSFRERINNNKTDEFQAALTQVRRIFRFRIEGRVDE